MTNSLEKYRQTHTREAYARFRNWKRRLYAAAPGQAYDLVEQAAEEAGWKESLSAKFARMS
jgi:hypothetical protein